MKTNRTTMMNGCLRSPRLRSDPAHQFMRLVLTTALDRSCKCPQLPDESIGQTDKGRALRADPGSASQ